MQSPPENPATYAQRYITRSPVGGARWEQLASELQSLANGRGRARDRVDKYPRSRRFLHEAIEGTPLFPDRLAPMIFEKYYCISEPQHLQEAASSPAPSQIPQA